MERFHLLIHSTRPAHPSPQKTYSADTSCGGRASSSPEHPDSSDTSRAELTPAAHIIFTCDCREMLSALGSSVPRRPDMNDTHYGEEDSTACGAAL